MSDSLLIHAVRPHEFGEWLALRAALWPDAEKSELEHEQAVIAAAIEAGRCAIFLATDGSTTGGRAAVGMIELTLREYVDGCGTSPVGYVEGWYVAPAFRRRGLGRRLLAAGEAWARSRGAREMASDTEVENTVSRAAHQRSGYREGPAIVLFFKSL